MRLFHINIKIKKKLDALFDFISQENLIAKNLVSKIGLEMHDNFQPCCLGSVKEDGELKATK
jgi:hypothetical protein